MQSEPDHVHRGEHVALLEANLHVDAADTRSLLEVAIVVGAGEQPFEPLLQGDLESRDLRLTLNTARRRGPPESPR